MTDIVGRIMQYEAGEMDFEDMLELFAEIIKSGVVWQLQGSYGRAAQSLIDAGFITEEGEINVDAG